MTTTPGTEKIAAENIAAVMARGSSVCRQLAEKNASLETENAGLREKLAGHERMDRCRKLAAVMEERGLSPDLTLEEKVASVSRYDDLDAVENAIKLAGGGKLELARVSDASAPGTGRNSVDDLHAFYATGRSTRD